MSMEKDDGWLAGIEHRASPHFDERPAGAAVDLAVVHFISLPHGVFGGSDIDALFMGEIDAEKPGYESLRGLRVSSHFFIDRHGRVVQYVDVFKRAWHAGLSNFRGRDACNDFSVGIELEGTEAVPFEAAQYDALGGLLKRLAALLPLRFVTGHEFIAPGRKIDPGPQFDWKRLDAMLPPGVERATSEADCSREMIAKRKALLEAAAQKAR